MKERITISEKGIEQMFSIPCIVMVGKGDTGPYAVVRIGDTHITRTAFVGDVVIIEDGKCTGIEKGGKYRKYAHWLETLKEVETEFSSCSVRNAIQQIESIINELKK